MGKKIFRTLSLATAVLLLLGLGITDREAHAQDSWLIYVTTTEDLRDFELNYNCSVGQPMGGPCSLRAAIYEASRHTLEPVKIMLPPGEYKLTRAEPGYEGEEEDHYGDLDFPDLADGKHTNIRIIGTEGWNNPSVIDANFIDRVMEIGKNQRVSLENLVLKNGFAGGVYNPYGGGLKVYEANVKLIYVRLTNNKAQGQFGLFPSYGGGIYSEKSYLEMYQCEFNYNTSDVSSAIHVKDHHGTTDISYSTFHNNIVNGSQDETSYMYFENELVMTNSTMSDNQGGDYNIMSIAPALIQNSTLASRGQPGIIHTTSNNLGLLNNILQIIPVQGYNLGIVCNVPEYNNPSLGGNIFSDESCKPVANDAVITYIDMFLGPLGKYGGFAPTIPLLLSSPAVDFGDGVCQDAYGEIMYWDQRYELRDNRCDPGSFELQADEEPTALYLPAIAR
ncbi:MAG: choice-of-anchor Q domain-containing protein [Anaerolineaceae bacterium]|jgi:hypothetical protein